MVVQSYSKRLQFLRLIEFILIDTTLEDLLLFNRNKLFWGWTQSDNTKTTIPRYNLMIVYVFKMAVAIAFLCENTVEAI